MTANVKSLIVLAVSALGVHSTAGGQERSDLTARCHAAAQAVGRGNAADSMAAGVLTLYGCERSGAHMAAAFRTYRDEPSLAAVDRFTHQLNAWRDADVLQAAITVAEDASATVPARVFAVRHLLILLQPYIRYSYESLVAGPGPTANPDGTVTLRARCAVAVASHRADRTSTPPPPDYVMRIRAVLRAIATGNGPQEVRMAAACDA